MLALAENARRDRCCRRARVRSGTGVDADSRGARRRLGRRGGDRRPERRARARGRRARVRAGRSAFAPPTSSVSVRPAALGAGLSVDAAVSAALAATPRSRIALPVRSSPVEGRGGRRLAREALRPRPGRRDGHRRDGRPAHAFRRPGMGWPSTSATMRSALAQVLRDGTRAPLTPAHAHGRAEADCSDLRRGDRDHPWGEHPAPLPRHDARAHVPRSRPARRSIRRRAGIWRIVDKQRDPWWYPPIAERVGEGPEAGAAGPVEPARDALDGAERARRRHPRHRRALVDRLQRLTRLHPDAGPGRRVAVRAGPLSGRPSSFSRQRHAQVGQQHDRAGERDEAADDQPRMARLAHGLGERPAEQDQDPADQPEPDQERRAAARRTGTSPRQQARRSLPLDRA